MPIAATMTWQPRGQRVVAYSDYRQEARRIAGESPGLSADNGLWPAAYLCLGAMPLAGLAKVEVNSLQPTTNAFFNLLARRSGPPQENQPRCENSGLNDLLDGMTPMEFILRFTFSNPDLDTTIVGTINPAHLQANLEILRHGPLPPDVYKQAKLRLGAA